MSRRRIWLFFLIIFPLYAAPAVNPTEPFTLTLDEAIERALDQSINLKKGAIDLAQAGYSASRLWSEIFPGFSLSAGLTFLPSTPLFTAPGFSYRTEALSYAFNFGVSLSLNPSFRASMERIELAYRSQLLSYENARKQLEIQVVRSFLGLQNRQENIIFLRERLETSLQRLEQDRIARQNGLLSEVAWLNSQLSVETARYNLSSALAAYKNALGEFLALIGKSGVMDFIFQGTVDIVPMYYDPELLIWEYLPKRPDIINQRQTIERMELTRSVTTHSLRSPTLELGTQWRGGSPTSGPRAGLADPFSDAVSGSINLRIPVDSWIPGTRQNQNIRAVNAEVEKARLDLQNRETQAKTQIRSIVSNLQNTWGSLEIARLRMEIAQRTVEATEVGFINGTMSFQELEDRRNDLSDARQRLLQGELSYRFLLLDLAAALNVNWRTIARGLL